MRSSEYGRILVPLHLPAPGIWDLGFGAGPAAPCTFAYPSPRRFILKNHHLNQLVLPAPRFPGWHGSTAGSTPPPCHGAGREGGREQHPTATPDLVWHLPLCQLLSLLPSAPSVSPQGGEPSTGAGLGTGGVWLSRVGTSSLCPPPPVRLKPSPGFLLEQQPGTAWPRLSGGPQIPVCSSRSRSKAPGAPGDVDRPRQTQIKALDGHLAPGKNQIPALVSGATTPEQIPPSSLPSHPGEGSPSPHSQSLEKEPSAKVGPSLSLFLLPIPAPSPELWLGQQHSRQRDTRGTVPSTRGHRHVPMAAAMELLTGTTKEQPRLHHPGGNPKPPRANSSTEFSRGHCSTKEPLNP